MNRDIKFYVTIIVAYLISHFIGYEYIALIIIVEIFITVTEINNKLKN